MFRHGLVRTTRNVAGNGAQLIAGFSLATLAAIFVNDCLYEITSIRGTSMQPTLSPNVHIDGSRDAVIWAKWSPTRNLQRGDVVLFHTPHDPNKSSVKRVIALEGDTVVLDPKRRPKDAENGRRNVDAKMWDIRYASGKGRVNIPEGHVWLEGDNMKATQDSNSYGPISRGLIEGRAVGLFWPFNQLGSRPWESYKIKTKIIKGVPPRSIRDEDNANGWWETH